MLVAVCLFFCTRQLLCDSQSLDDFTSYIHTEKGGGDCTRQLLCDSQSLDDFTSYIHTEKGGGVAPDNYYVIHKV